MGLITDEIRALIGVESESRISPIPVSEEFLRRFTHAVMEENPVHWDTEMAGASRYCELVAPPLFPLHAWRRAAGEPDPFEVFETDSDYDGTFVGTKSNGLPPIELPLPRLLNGGTEAEFFKLARVGDIISARSKYVDIAERVGRDGSPMVIVKTTTTYFNQDDEVLAIITMSLIRR